MGSVREISVRKITGHQLTLLRNDAEQKAVAGPIVIPDDLGAKQKRLFLNRLAASRSRARNKHCKCVPAAEVTAPRPIPYRAERAALA